MAPIATPLAVPPVALTALAQPPPAEATPPATAAVEPAAAGTVAAEQVPTPDAAGRIALSRSSGDLVVNVTLVPQALGTSEYDVSLEDAAGRPFTAARRVAVKLALQGMSHGLFSREGTAAGPGRYLASGNDLVMSGPWHGWVVVDLPDGSVRVVDFAFQTGPPLPAVVQERIRSDSPPGVQLVNVAAYPDELLALPLSLMPGTPARVEAVLADGATCGGRLRVPSLGLEAPFSAGGFARLDFPVDRLMVLTARCGEQGLDLLEEP